MRKKVLVISSSPRKNGNSNLLCDEFSKGAQQQNNQVEQVFLKEYSINYCTGCGYCFNNRGKCSQKDDMVLMKEKMIEADVIVFATPIYFYTMSGQMKTFIDRNCFFYTEVKNKEFYYIMTAAAGKSAMDRTIQEFSGYLDCLTAPKVKGMIIADGVWNTGDVKGTKHMQDAFELGKGV